VFFKKQNHRVRFVATIFSLKKNKQEEEKD
jgi:hypothetical protein